MRRLISATIGSSGEQCNKARAISSSSTCCRRSRSKIWSGFGTAIFGFATYELHTTIRGCHRYSRMLLFEEIRHAGASLEIQTRSSMVCSLPILSRIRITISAYRQPHSTQASSIILILESKNAFVRKMVISLAVMLCSRAFASASLIREANARLDAPLSMNSD